MDVTPNAARKWLQGLGMPEMEMAIRLADWGNVNLSWLLQGYGQKRGDRVDLKALVLDEALHAMPAAESRQALEFLRYTINRSSNLAAEQRARYDVALELFIKDLGISSAS